MKRPRKATSARRGALAAVAVCTAALVLAAFVPACTTSARKPTATEVAIASNTPFVPSGTATGSMTHTITNTRTSTYSPTFTITNTPQPTPAVTGTPVTITVDCWNAGNCNVCGATSYVCLTTFTSCTFTDPCPGGMTAHQIAADVYGLPCNNGLGFSTDVNGTALGNTSGVASYCNCSTCANYVHQGSYYGGGFPGYISGGTNTFNLTGLGGNTFCLAYVNLLIGCQ